MLSIFPITGLLNQTFRRKFQDNHDTSVNPIYQISSYFIALKYLKSLNRSRVNDPAICENSPRRPPLCPGTWDWVWRFHQLRWWNIPFWVRKKANTPTLNFYFEKNYCFEFTVWVKNLSLAFLIRGCFPQDPAFLENDWQSCVALRYQLLRSH